MSSIAYQLKMNIPLFGGYVLETDTITFCFRLPTDRALWHHMLITAQVSALKFILLNSAGGALKSFGKTSASCTREIIHTKLSTFNFTFWHCTTSSYPQQLPVKTRRLADANVSGKSSYPAFALS